MKFKVAGVTVMILGVLLVAYACNERAGHPSGAGAALAGTAAAPAESDASAAAGEQPQGDPEGASDHDADQQQQAGGTLEEKLTSLKELRDSGVLTPDQYEAKVRALQGGSQQPSGAMLPENPPLRTVEIMDPELEGGMRAGTMQIPADWKFGGAIIHSGGCHGNGAQVQYKLQSPDGLFAIEVYPTFVWRNTGQAAQPRNISPRIAQAFPPPRNPCDPVEISSAGEFLEHVVLPNLRPWATVINIGPLKEPGQKVIRQRLEVLRENSEREAEQERAMNFPKGQHPDQHLLDGGIAYLGYKLNGHDVEETVAAAVHCRAAWMPGSYVSTPSVNVNCNSWPVVVLRGPRGALMKNMPRLLAIKSTYQIDRTWDFVMAELIRQRGQMLLQASQEQFRAMMHASDVAAQIRTAEHEANMAQSNANFSNSQAAVFARERAMDESAHQTVLYAADERAFVDPRTGTEYDITNRATNAYLGSDGTIIGSDGPLNITSTVPGISYTQLPTKY